MITPEQLMKMKQARGAYGRRAQSGWDSPYDPFDDLERSNDELRAVYQQMRARHERARAQEEALQEQDASRAKQYNEMAAQEDRETRVARAKNAASPKKAVEPKKAPADPRLTALAAQFNELARTVRPEAALAHCLLPLVALLVEESTRASGQPMERHGEFHGEYGDRRLADAACALGAAGVKAIANGKTSGELPATSRLLVQGDEAALTRSASDLYRALCVWVKTQEGNVPAATDDDAADEAPEGFDIRRIRRLERPQKRGR